MALALALWLGDCGRPIKDWFVLHKPTWSKQLAQTVTGWAQKRGLLGPKIRQQEIGEFSDLCVVFMVFVWFLWF